MDKFWLSMTASNLQATTNEIDDDKITEFLMNKRYVVFFL